MLFPFLLLLLFGFYRSVRVSALSTAIIKTILPSHGPALGGQLVYGGDNFVLQMQCEATATARLEHLLVGESGINGGNEIVVRDPALEHQRINRL